MKNIKRILAVALSVLLIVSMLAACNNNNEEQNTNNNQNETSNNNNNSNNSNNTNENDSSADADVIAFEDIDFPEVLPTNPPMAEEGWYGYDDMEEEYSIEILTHHYGQPNLPDDEDPINIWLSEKFNLDISLNTMAQEDVETTLSTRFASGDEPDISYLPTRDLAFVLSDQGLLLDAKNIYPYMPQTCKFATSSMIKWSTNTNGELPFITKYGIQDGVWGFAIRQDWLEKFDMDAPTTKEDLIEYAVKCTEEDPDGDGNNNTYFMTGAGGGASFGMLDGFNTMFGNPSAHVDEDGELSHPYFNGVRKEFLMFINELYELDVLAPDWYTIDWETAKSYTMNDQIGMVWYPAGSLFTEYAEGAKQGSVDALDNWLFWEETPIENGKYIPSGNPGYMWGFASSRFEDEGKIQRVAHMLDTMVIGGENFFHTIQGGSDEVFENAGIEVEDSRTWKYLDNGTFYYSNDPNAFPWGADDGYLMPLSIWQEFGLSVIWQLTDPESEDEFKAAFAEKSNSSAQIINSYERWPNDALKVTLTDDAAEAQTSMTDWISAQEIAFVTGDKDFSEWEDHAQEWLDKGGSAIIEQTAKALGTEVPDYAK